MPCATWYVRSLRDDVATCATLHCNLLLYQVSGTTAVQSVAVLEIAPRLAKEKNINNTAVLLFVQIQPFGRGT